MSFFTPQNPGLGGIDELTSSEEEFVQNIVGLTYAQGDILYYNGTNLVNLGPGTSGQFLKTNGAGANPEWATAAGGGDMVAATYDPANISEQLVGLTATQSISNKTLTATDYIGFDTAAAHSVSQGEMAWNADEETMDLGLNGAVLQMGQETHYHVRNNSGATITNGTPVMATGTVGASGRITIDEMDGSDIANAKFFLGLTTEDITNGSDGKVTSFGKVRGLDTSAWTDGDVLWVDTVTPGVLTNTQPTSGTRLPVAFVIYSNPAAGVLAVRATDGTYLDEAHDTSFTSVATGEIIKYDGTRWINNTLAEAGIAADTHTHSLDEMYDDGGSGLGRTITADSGAVEVTVPNTGNNAGLIINQNDTTNNPTAVDIKNTGSGKVANFEHDNSSGNGVYITLYANDGTPNDLDLIGEFDFTGNNSAAQEVAYAGIQGFILDTTDTTEDGAMRFNVYRAGSYTQMLEVGSESLSQINGISVGATTAAGVLSSRGNQDLILQTGNTTTGSVTITDGANGAINIAPNGSGEAQVAGQKIIDETDTASTTVAGISELATTAEVDTGTDTGRTITPDALAGSYAGTKSVVIQAEEMATDLAVGDDLATFYIPTSVGGMDLVTVYAYVDTAGTTGTTDIQIHNETQAADMLSTKITIDSTETSSRTAATAAVIDTANDDVAAGDKIRIDVDAVSTTAPKGLFVELEFRLP